jgi:hypothetical protein
MSLPTRIGSILLAMLVVAVLPASASGQASYKKNSSGSTAGAAQYNEYDDDYDDGGGVSPGDEYYDDSYDEEADSGGQEPTGPLPDTPKKPAKTPVTPVTPVAPVVTPLPAVTVPGRTARMMSNGKAAAPKGAPKAVRKMIAAANRLIGKPYKWGGGHAKIEDKGYDCSGTVSYALIASGHLASPMVSGSFTRWGRAGVGRWVTIYANKGHIYMEIAGLRLDTSPIGDPSVAQGPRWRPVIGKRKGFKVRHPVGL